MERLNNRSAFDGPVSAGVRHVLVDDVMTLGGTLAEPANHIQVNGGLVAGVVVSVNASRSDNLTAGPDVLLEMERRYGDTTRGIFGIDPSALTALPKPATLLGSVPLTNSEIEALRRDKKRISDYAQRVLSGWAAKPAD